MVCRACLAGGLGTFLVGCGFTAYQAVWLSRSVPARGTITQLVPVEDPEQKTTNYALRFTFKTEDGQSYTVESSVASNPPAFEVGEPVRVLYLRSNPPSAKLDSFWQLWFVSVVSGFLGILYSGVGYLFLRYERRRLSSPVADRYAS